MFETFRKSLLPPFRRLTAPPPSVGGAASPASEERLYPSWLLYTSRCVEETGSEHCSTDDEHTAEQNDGGVGQTCIYLFSRKNAQNTENGTSSVSYTHLDVYKRQIPKCAAAAKSMTYGARMSGVKSHIAPTAMKIRTGKSSLAMPASVSYTHLDVYKRQC